MYLKLNLLPLPSVNGSSRSRSRVGGVGGTVLRDGCNRSLAVPRVLPDLRDGCTAVTDPKLASDDNDAKPFVAAVRPAMAPADCTQSRVYVRYNVTRKRCSNTDVLGQFLYQPETGPVVT